MELATTILGRRQDAQRLHKVLETHILLCTIVRNANWLKENQKNPMPWDEVEAGAGHLRAAAASLEVVSSRVQKLLSVYSPALISVDRHPVPNVAYREGFISELRNWADFLDTILRWKRGPGWPPDLVAEKIALCLAEVYVEFTGQPFQDRATETGTGPRFVHCAMRMLKLGYGAAQIGTAIKRAGQQLRRAPSI
jgi:hypothetical protein